MAQSGIYKITSPSGKIYIGQSSNIERRMIEHKYRSKSKNLKLYSSLRKYGIDNHKIDILFLSKDKYEKDRMESIYIKYYDTINNGLNHIDTLSGGCGFSGKKHTEENVLKIKERMNGYKPTKAIEKRMKKVFCGYTNKYYNSISDCAKDLNVSRSLLSLQLNGKKINKYNII
jgi:group I intron endonuclease